MHSIEQFLESGGDILWLILGVSFCLWTLVIERILYFKYVYPKLQSEWIKSWQTRQDKYSQAALSIRRCIISEAKLSMMRFIPMIKMLVALCPLFGLLGTVTGMIHVFDALAYTGTGNARAMASGVSHATIPTMAGMVIAIAGLYVSRLIEQKVSEEIHHLTDLLQYY